MQTPLIFFLALVFVLALIGLVAYLVRRFGGSRLGNSGGRGRAPRLAVIDQAAVDGRRRLVLVRRDNVEHLLMIGGPSDIVVEPNIVRGAAPGRDLPRSGDSASRAAESASWADSDYDAPDVQPEPLVRAPQRQQADAEIRRSMPPVAPIAVAPASERRADALASFAPEPAVRPEPIRPEPLRAENTRPESRPDPRMDVRAELQRANLRAEPAMNRPMTRALDNSRNVSPVRATDPVRVDTPRNDGPRVDMPAAAASGPAPDLSKAEADQNLSDMAKRLEAALRRPQGEPSTTSTEAPIVRPIIRNEPVASSAPPVAPPVTAASIKTGFENLEDEMASLLGRPKNPT